jgi:hypothetical protein
VRTRRVCALLCAWLCTSFTPTALAEPGEGESRYPFAPGRDEADDFAPHETHGPALSIGVGDLYAGYGAELAYHFAPLREQWLAIAPHLAVGKTWAPAGYDGQLGVRGGALLAYGGERRVLLDVAFGALRTHGLRLHGVRAASRVVDGVSLALGVERMDVRGLFLRALIGGYFLTSRGVDDGDRLGVLFALGAGWKPW